MTDTRGTFRLRNVRQDVLNNEYVPIPSVWVSNTTTTGYYAGGFVGGNIYIPYPTPSSIENATVVSKLTYSSSSIARAPSADLPDKNCDSGPFSSSTDGYMVGGSNNAQGRNSYVRKLTYATDTTTTLSPRHSQNIQGLAAFSYNDSKAFTTGGRGGPSQDGSWGNNTMRIYSLPTCTNSSAPHLGNAVSHTTQTISSSSSGYVAGGVADFSPAPTVGFLRSYVQKLTFSNNTNARSPSSDLVVPIKGSSAAGGSTDGYFMGGGTDDMTYAPTTSQIQKFTYSTDTTALNPSNMLDQNQKGSATGNSSSGFSAGGIDENPIYTNAITKISFSTGTTSNSGVTLPQGPRNGIGAFSSVQSPLPDSKVRWFDSAAPTGNKMYCLGGTGGGEDHDSFNMTTETTTNLSFSAFDELEKGCSAQNTTHSYIHAGGGKQTKVRKITWSTDVGVTLPGTTSRPAENKSGTGNETKGYFTQGGSSPGPCYSGSDRVTYASDTIERVPSADMVGGRPGKFGAQATGNQETGYFMGGGGEWPGFPNYSDTNKLTYATDTNANCPAQMPTGMSMYAGSSASSSTAAYASNYRNPSFHSKVFKLVFATDTVDTVGNTTVQRNGPAMGGNGTTMYMGGGSNFPNGDRSDFDKLVYATDTISNLSDSNLQSARYYITGSGQRGERIPFAEPPTATPTASTFPSVNPALNVNAVFAAGAGPSSSTNQRSKLTFSNETMASMPAFADSQNTFGGASSTTRGYLSGSFGNTSLGDTQNKRWYNQYSNDTSALLPSRTSQNAGGMYSMNDETKLYSGGGGWSGGQYNTAESMPFATEENSSEPGMTLTSPKKFASGIGNKTIGFVCGGNEGNNNRTTIDKVVYSTGTMSTSPSNLTLSGASPYHATMAVGNTTTGYIFQNSPTNKLVFATETVSSAPNNNTANSWGNGTSSVTTGYVMNHPSGQYLIKYVFSTETTGTLPGMFSPNRGRGGAMSTAMFGGAYTSVPNVI